MKIGDVVLMKSATACLDRAEFGFKAKNSRKGDRLVFLFLGHHDHNNRPFDPEQALRELGWIPKEEGRFSRHTQNEKR